MADPLRESAVRAVVISRPPRTRARWREERGGKLYHGRRISKHTIESERGHEREEERVRERAKHARERERARMRSEGEAVDGGAREKDTGTPGGRR